MLESRVVHNRCVGGRELEESGSTGPAGTVKNNPVSAVGADVVTQVSGGFVGGREFDGEQELAEEALLVFFGEGNGLGVAGLRFGHGIEFGPISLDVGGGGHSADALDQRLLVSWLFGGRTFVGTVSGFRVRFLSRSAQYGS